MFYRDVKKVFGIDETILNTAWLLALKEMC